jgi:hypothetical protein
MTLDNFPFRGKRLRATDLLGQQLAGIEAGDAVGEDDRRPGQQAMHAWFFASIDNEDSGGGGEYDEWTEVIPDGAGGWTAGGRSRDETSTGRSIFEANLTEGITADGSVIVLVHESYGANGFEYWFVAPADNAAGIGGCGMLYRAKITATGTWTILNNKNARGILMYGVFDANDVNDQVLVNSVPDARSELDLFAGWRGGGAGPDEPACFEYDSGGNSAVVQFDDTADRIYLECDTYASDFYFIAMIFFTPKVTTNVVLS